MAVSPATNSLRGTVLLTTQAAQDVPTGTNPIPVAVEFVNTPVGYMFRVLILADDGWRIISTGANMWPSAFYGQGITTLIERINEVGIVKWIVDNVIPWVNKVLKSFFVGKVPGSSAPLPPPADEITALNLEQQVGLALSVQFKLTDTDGDGIPELTVK